MHTKVKDTTYVKMLIIMTVYIWFIDTNWKTKEEICQEIFQSPCISGSQLRSNHSGGLKTNSWCSVAKYIEILHVGAGRAQRLWRRTRWFQSHPQPPYTSVQLELSVLHGVSTFTSLPLLLRREFVFSISHIKILKGPAHGLLLLLARSTNWKLSLFWDSVVFNLYISSVTNLELRALEVYSLRSSCLSRLHFSIK